MVAAREKQDGNSLRADYAAVLYPSLLQSSYNIGPTRFSDAPQEQMARVHVPQSDFAQFPSLVDAVGGRAGPQGLTPAQVRMALAAANAFSLLGGISYGLLGLVLNLPDVVTQSQWTSDNRKSSMHVRHSVVELELRMTLVSYSRLDGSELSSSTLTSWTSRTP